MSEIWQQVRGGYADQAFRLPQEELPVRARRRRRRMTTTAVTTGMLVAAAGGVVVLGGGDGGAPMQLPFAAAPGAERLDSADYLAEVTPEAAADCLALAEASPAGMFGSGPPASPGADVAGADDTGAAEPFRPDAAFGFADEHQWFTLLVSEEYRVGCWAAFDDERGVPVVSQTGGPGYPDGWLGDGPLPAFHHHTGQGGNTAQSYVVGLAPPGTERVDVVLRDGTVVAAVLDGEWFVAWLPGAAGLTFLGTISEVVAYTPEGQVRGAGEMPPPAFPTGPPQPAPAPTPTVLPDTGPVPSPVTPPSPGAGD
jgi:hypothetical protein